MVSHRARALRPPSSVRVFLATCGAVVCAALGCGPTVDCEALCRRTLACEVEFTAPDDPTGAQVASGERSELESCTLGCEASSLVTVESASCIDGLDTRDAASCQGEVLACLGADDDGAQD
jgi:hypothetical protein